MFRCRKKEEDWWQQSNEEQNAEMAQALGLEVPAEYQEYVQ